jgi:FMN phosphatase YigB (HAD superfamily)
MSAADSRSAVRLAFLIDVDNTLLDNDAVKADLADRLEQLMGAEHAESFWAVYEDVRRASDFVDLPRTLGQFRAHHPDARGFPQVADLVLGYPYADALYPGALDTVRHLRALGQVIIVSDGDPVYQAAKIARAGLADAVNAVVLFAHKENHFDELRERFPADRHVLIDDKLRILATAKHLLGDAARTVFVRQGKYAVAEAHRYPPADLTVEHIADLLATEASAFA